MTQKSPPTAGRPPGPSFFRAASGSLRARREPLEFARELVKEYGDLVSYRIGSYTGYLVRHPDHVGHVLSDRHWIYGKNNRNYEELKPVLGAGLITSEGEDWVCARRRLRTLFRRQRIDNLAPVISRATSDMLMCWDAAVARGESIDVSEQMSILTMRVIGTLLFDLDIASDAGSIAKNFDVLNENVAYRFRNPFVMPRWAPTRRNGEFKRALRDLETRVYHFIQERREECTDKVDLVKLLRRGPASSGVNEETPDRHVRDHAVTLILAGYETTAALLGWAWFLLAVHPEWTTILRQELQRHLGGKGPRVEDLSKLRYTHAVLQEALRLYPPVWIISRKAMTEDELGGYRVPAGTVVTISAYLLHRHPAFWEEPDAFRPQRFLDRPVEHRHPFSYLPFGAGPRQCIGSHLAVMESMLVLARVIMRYDPHIPSDGRSRPDPLITLRPNVPLRSTPRMS